MQIARPGRIQGKANPLLHDAKSPSEGRVRPLVTVMPLMPVHPSDLTSMVEPIERIPGTIAGVPGERAPAWWRMPTTSVATRSGAEWWTR
jgi:hypothetical protein